MPGIFVDGFVCAHCFLHIFDSFKIMKNVFWSFKKSSKSKYFSRAMRSCRTRSTLDARVLFGIRHVIPENGL